MVVEGLPKKKAIGDETLCRLDAGFAGNPAGAAGASRPRCSHDLHDVRNAGRTICYLPGLFGSGFRRTVLLRTINVSLIVTVIALVIGFITAYVVSRAPGWLKSILIIAAVFPLLTGVVVRSFAWLIILGKNGILNSTLINLGLIGEPLSMLYTQGSVIVAMVYLFVPLMVLTLVGVLEAIPDDLIQASASLGANSWATFTQVILPLAVPGLIVGAVLVFTGSFTSYATPQLLGGEQVMMMGTLMYQQAMVTFDWVSASTIAAIMVVITIAIVMAMNAAARRLNPMTV